jgi:hypothetical protein
VHVERRDPAAQQADHRDADRVEAAEHQHLRPGAAQPGDGHVKQLGERVRVRPRAQQVIAAAGDRDEAGRHRRRRGHLLGDDLPQQLAADRQVRVTQPRVLDGEQPGCPVGPAAETAARRGIVEALGETVANRHEGRAARGLRE